MAVIKLQDKYDIGDIVFARKFKYPNGGDGEHHLFVILNDDGELVPMEYFSLIVSSQIEKSKERSNYQYNEPLPATEENGLTKKSIVKCDELFSLDKDYIIYKIGAVDAGDLLRFLNSYESSISN